MIEANLNLQQLLDELDWLRVKVKRLESSPQVRDDRRERIATAALQGLLANTDRRGSFEDFAKDTVEFADALIAELDKDDRQ